MKMKDYPPLIWRYSSVSQLGLSVVFLLIIFAYWDSLGDMVHRWNTKEEYGYGYFIPFVSAFLIWQRRNQVIVREFVPSWWGFGVMLFAAVLFILGEIAATYTLVQYSLVIAIIGIALALMGWQAFKLVMGPLFLLFFIVPLPPFIYNTLSGKLQLISSEMGVWFIRQFGISVFLEGNVIDLGHYKLQVVEACNGLRYLFPLVSVAFIAAYLYKVAMWKRGLVFFSSIPITVFMNSFRIGVIGLLVEYWGVGQAEGFLHYFEGWIIFMTCLLILLLEMSLLARIGAHTTSLREVFGLEWPEPLPAGLEKRIWSISSVHYGLLAAAVFIALGSLYVKQQVMVQPPRLAFSGFPQQIGEWAGKDETLEQIYLDSLKLDDYYLADYQNQQGDFINFYAAYYASQQAGSAAHSPRACIPGGGWQIEDVTQIKIPGVDVNGRDLQVNRLVIKQGDFKQLVYYWFQQRGRNIASEWLVKWYLFQDGLMKQRTDGGLIRVTTIIGPGEAWADGDRRLAEFVKEVAPLLQAYIPE